MFIMKLCVNQEKKTNIETRAESDKTVWTHTGNERRSREERINCQKARKKNQKNTIS